MRWTMAKARQRFAEAIEAAEKDPQPIYRRDQLVAVIVGQQEYQLYLEWKERERRPPNLADAFAELREIAGSQGWTLLVPERADRSNPLLDEPDALPR